MVLAAETRVRALEADNQRALGRVAAAVVTSDKDVVENTKAVKAATERVATADKETQHANEARILVAVLNWEDWPGRRPRTGVVALGAQKCGQRMRHAVSQFHSLAV